MQHQKIEIPISENDAQDLVAGERFEWTFETDKGESIDVILRPETQADIES